MKTLKYGIVSAAKIAPRFISAIQQTSHSVVTAIASTRIEQAQQYADDYNIEAVYDNYEDLYNDNNVDIVYICNTNENHYQEIKRALSFKKHVICEKPFVLYPHEVTELFEIAKKQNCFLMETQKSVFLPTTNLVKEYIKSKELGELKLIDLTISFSGQFNDDNHWMLDPHQGGAWIPSANYIIELLNYLMDGFPTEYQAMVNKHHRGAIDEASITLRYNELLAHGFVTMRVLTDDIMRIYFENGHISIKHFWKSRSLTIHTDENTEIKEFPAPFEMVYEVDHIYDCVSKGLLQSPIMSEKMTYHCVKLVDDVVKANN